MNKPKLIHFYGTNDLAKTHQFYHDVLGFKVYKDQGVCMIYHFFDSYIGFCTHLPIVHQHKSPIITLVVDDVDMYYERLLKIDQEIKPPKLNKQFKIYHFYTTDPNGYTIEIQRFI